MDFSRNWLFVSPKIQNDIKTKKIFFAGVGLGSQISVAMARLGFENFILADGDVFSESNMNRQHCFISDINKNKAEATAVHINNINPNCKIKVFPHFLKTKDLESFIRDSDYVVNCIDFDSSEYIECHNLCKKYNKKEIFIINLGFGSVASISDSMSPNYIDFFKESDPSKLKDIMLNYFISNSPNSSVMSQYMERYSNEKSKNPEPQIISGCYSSSILTLKIILNDISGVENKSFPFIYGIDPLF